MATASRTPLRVIAEELGVELQPSPFLPRAISDVLMGHRVGDERPALSKVAFHGKISLMDLPEGAKKPSKKAKKPRGRGGAETMLAFLLDDGTFITAVEKGSELPVVHNAVDLRKSVLQLHSSTVGHVRVVSSLELRVPGETLHFRGIGAGDDAGAASASHAWVPPLRAVLFNVAPPPARASPGWRHRLVLGTLFAAAVHGDAKEMARLLMADDVSGVGRAGAGASAGAGGGGGSGRSTTPSLGTHNAPSPSMAGPSPTSAAVTVASTMGFHVMDTDEDGNSALHLAADKQVGVVALLLENGADANALNAVGSSPLSISCACGLDDVVEALLQHGANPDSVDEKGVTPMHVAMACQHLPSVTRVVRKLCSYRPELEADLRRRVSAAADDGRTPLHAWTERVLLSSTDSNPGLVRVVTGLLCPPGVVLDKTDREGGMSALHMACGGMFLADERLKSHDCTPVSPEIAKRLIDAGAIVNAPDGSGRTPLHLVLSALESYAKIAEQSSSMSASKVTAFLHVVRTLMAHGSKLDSVDRDGNTARGRLQAVGATVAGLLPAGSLGTSRTFPEMVLTAAAEFVTLGSIDPPESRPLTECPKVLWTPDSDLSFCPLCHHNFSFKIRKHHCRKCGFLVCDGCSSKRANMFPDADVNMKPRRSFMVKAEAAVASPARVCDCCFNMLMHDIGTPESVTVEVFTPAAADVSDVVVGSIAESPVHRLPSQRTGVNPPISVWIKQARNLRVVMGGTVISRPFVVARMGRQEKRTEASGVGPVNCPEWHRGLLLFGVVPVDAVEEDSDDDSDGVAAALSASAADSLELQLWSDETQLGALTIPLGPLRRSATGHAVVDGWQHLRFRGDSVGEVLVRVEEAVTASSSQALTRLCDPLAVTVLEGRSLLAADFDGTSDPYVVVRVGSQEVYTSKVRRSTLNPNWGERDAHYVFAEDNSAALQQAVADASSIDIEVWDKDVLKPDDPMGGLSVDLDAVRDLGYAVYQHWLPVVYNGEVKGELHVRAQFLAPPPPPPPPPQPAPAPVAPQPVAPPPVPAAVAATVDAESGPAVSAAVPAAAVETAPPEAPSAGDGAAAAATASEDHASDVVPPKPPRAGCCVVM